MSSFAIIPFANSISGCVMERTTVETTLTKPQTCVVRHFPARDCSRISQSNAPA